MSVTRSPHKKGYAPSDMVDAMVLAVLAFVCLTGALLTTPQSTLDHGDVSLTLADGSFNPVYIPVLTIPEITVPDTIAPTPAPDTPSAPAIKPPPDIDVPSVKPELPENTIQAITLRTLPELSESQLIPTGPGFISLMGTNYDPTNWHRSTHMATSDFLATDWVAENAIYDAEGLSLRLEPSPDKADSFLGGEIQTQQTYGYGRYEVLMRPAKGSGIVSSFFTYTGPYFGNPHDEVDFEFLGEDTTKIYLNYFRNGQVGEDQTLELPFDASEEMHLYAFEWRPDSITWFIDGQPVHQTRSGDRGIPRTPGSIIVNLWSGQPKLRGWHGSPDFTGPVEADYGCISFQPIGGTGRSCSTIFPPEGPKAPEARTSIFARTTSRFLRQFIPLNADIAQIN